MNEEVLKRTDETYEDYLRRLFDNKENYGLTYPQIGKLLDEYNESPHDESKYRKDYKKMTRPCNIKDENPRTTILLTHKYDEVAALREERVRLRDERNALNAAIRDKARVDRFYEELYNTLAASAPYQFPCRSPIDMEYSDSTMFVCLSDLHIGQSIDTENNVYNTDVACSRIKEYLDSVKYAQENNYHANTCVVALMGDLISGNIHSRLRITNCESLVAQVKTAAALVAEFVKELASCFGNVHVISVPGNHSRVDKKDDALIDERLDNLIPFYIQAKLSEWSNIAIHDNMDGTITKIEINDEEHWFVHGDYDVFSPNGAASLIAYQNCKMPKSIVYAHHHQSQFVAGTPNLVESGCLSGCGCEFTKEHRIQGVASQMMFVCTPDGNMVFHPIILK